jgi:hypothetical protein
MRMDAPPLARLEHDQVHPEGAHVQRAPQRLETLVAVTIERRERDVGVGHRASIEPPAIRASGDATSRGGLPQGKAPRANIGTYRPLAGRDNRGKTQSQERAGGLAGPSRGEHDA